MGLFRREAKIRDATTQALDFVVSEARRYKMRLILSLCNIWEDYGGKAQYVRWGKEAGVDLTSDDDFFSDPTLKGYYKAFVERDVSSVSTAVVVLQMLFL
ncbi:Mannan endo-1,4-beta-mannosidase 7 [Hordeum vulgare]|nr:Mannan endo-1,4-beta-mannosidase 7 [Hordeum vulgare]